jgi:copper/silver efflux system protein
MSTDSEQPRRDTVLDRAMRFCLEQKLVVFLFLALVVVWGLMVAPFDWDLGGLPRDPVPTDAIPDISENQQIVFTAWPGRSPQDVQDRITYPLTSSLLGTSGVKVVRASSMFGFSSIYVIFEEGVDLDTARNRLLSKLSSLPAGMPEGVKPQLGPEATAVGQVFWYTLEGRDEKGRPTGGWDLHELRTVQDWYLKYDLLAAKDKRGQKPIAEVASVGGYVKEYQVDVDPDALRVHGVTLNDVFRAVKRSNADVGARTIEVNKVEYFVRGVGYIKQVSDIENSVIKVRDSVPIYVKNVARVTLGPALRRGALDKEGAEAVGGVVVVRYGANPLSAIEAVKTRLSELGEAGQDEQGAYWLLRSHHKTLPDGRTSYVAVVPFYDRTGLIYETLDTLGDALALEVLITIIVVLVMVRHLRSSLLIAASLPVAILICFIAMKTFGVDANIVALSGIAIAIGTIVDMGIILSENVLKHFDAAGPGERRIDIVFRASREVGGAILTAVLTTIVGFLPVFVMTGAEGKLFRPLAFTKTFALIASLIVALAIVPAGAHLLIRRRKSNPRKAAWLGATLFQWLVVLVVAVLLAVYWRPLGGGSNIVINFLFIALVVGGLLFLFHLFMRAYPRILRWCLDHKLVFLSVPVLLIALGLTIWLGFGAIFGVETPDKVDGDETVWERVALKFPGLGSEFMPSLDEGSFLYMPTTMPHASIGECLEVLQQLDKAIKTVPEVDLVVGKLGRADSPLDPAPISMVETVITYKPEYGTNKDGERVRNWRPEIRGPDDIWAEITKAAKMPGVTGAPKLQPIITRIVMLQSGMRAPMGVKVFGPDQASIERTALQIEKLLKRVPSILPDTVAAERLVGKPYLEIEPDRRAAARYGINVQDVQDIIEIAIGGRIATRTVEGRESYPVRVRYPRELRNQIETLGSVLVPTPDGKQIPLSQLTNLRDLDDVYRRGPMAIRSEDAQLVSYVTFDKKPGRAEVDVVEECRDYLDQMQAENKFRLDSGVTYAFAGTYENQLRARKTLMIVLPLALFAIFMILYFQFRRVSVTAIVFSGIAVAWAGGFLLIWLYGQPSFLDFSILGVNLRDLFQIHTVNLSVAIWVGFLALFGIASDDGVVMATYLDQSFSGREPETVPGIRDAVVAAGARRIRACLMTTATTILALLPVLTSTGRGSDVMIPMAIPVFGGMLIEVLTMLVVPVLYCLVKEVGLPRR